MPFLRAASPTKGRPRRDRAKRRQLAKHKDQLHPYALRYLLEELRAGEDRYATLAKRYGDVAAQFEANT